MSTVLKENWLEVKERYKAWWNKESNRALIQVTSPKNKEAGFVHDWDGWDFARDPRNPEIAIKKFEEFASRIYFGGDAYPHLFINLGPGVLAAYLGALPRFREDSKTVWFETPTEWEKIEDMMRFDPNNYWWKMTKNIASVVSRESENKFVVGTTDLGGVLDTLASLRGSKNLTVDLFKNPKRVLSASRKILDLWFHYYDELYVILNGKNRGTDTWMGIWCPKKWYPVQCDFSIMLSPKLFKEFALPLIQEQCKKFDYVIYHLDGAIQHLDYLLSVEEITGIQWEPGVNRPGIGSSIWFPLYKKILKKDKLLVLFASNGVQKSEVLPLLNEIGPKGVIVRTFCNSKLEAENLLKKLQEHNFI
ncbi:MAG: hypothetical protein ACP5KW_11370 [Thermoproteota archaeon]|jgi:5-methyltetrahydrofolate--homocysteine methyltransferase